jgi:hypothetical protein
MSRKIMGILCALVSVVHGLPNKAQVTVGDIRVQALSSRVIRIERKGPRGFEDRATFTSVNRSWAGVALNAPQLSSGGFNVSTDELLVQVTASAVQAKSCWSMTRVNTRYFNAPKSKNNPHGLYAADVGACCDACDADSDCNGGWGYQAKGEKASTPRRVDMPEEPSSSSCDFQLKNNTDVNGPSVLKDHSSAQLCNSSLTKCCALCSSDKECMSFVLAPPSAWSTKLCNNPEASYCFLLASYKSTHTSSGSQVGNKHRTPTPAPAPPPVPPPPTPKPNCVLFADNKMHNTQQTWDADDRSIFGCPRRGCVGSPLQLHANVYRLLKRKGAGQAVKTVPVLLGSTDHAAVPFRFPDPSAIPRAFALRDSPRFVVPAWGATPAPTSVDPALRNSSGYDSRNDADDVYIFVPPLPTTDPVSDPPTPPTSTDAKSAYAALRSDVLGLTGQVPRLPDWAFGIWFTEWHYYSQVHTNPPPHTPPPSPLLAGAY